MAPKTLLLRADSLLALACFVFLALSGASFYWQRLRSKLTWIPGVLLVVATITSLLGENFYVSLWSGFERGDGLLTLFSVVSLFYMVLLYADRTFVDRLLKTVAVTSMLVACYGLLQWVQAVTGINIPIITEPLGRLGSTIGNAAFLGSYLSMSIFVLWALLVSAEDVWKKVLVAGIALEILVVILTATRGSMLALLTTAGVAVLYGAIKGEQKTKSISRILVGSGIAALILFGLFRSQIAQIPFEPIQRIASISLSDTTTSSRLFIWKNFLPLALEKPVLGYGAENIDSLFDKIYDPGQIVEQWFDRSHNSFFDYQLQYGIFGLLAFITIILSIVLVGLELYRKGEIAGGFLSLMAIAYAVNNFFVFDTGTTLWLLFAVLAVVFVLYSDAEVTETESFPYVNIVGGAISLVLVILIIPVAINPLRANYAMYKGYNMALDNPKLATEILNKGFALDTYANLEYGYQAYLVYTEQQFNTLSGENLETAYEYARGVLSANYEKYPLDTRTAMYYAHVLDLAPPTVARDEALISQVLLHAKSLSEKRDQIWYLFANVEIRDGDNATDTTEKFAAYMRAIDIFKEYLQLAPKHTRTHYVIANMYVVMNQPAEAAMWAQKGLSVYRGDGVGIDEAVQYYVATEDAENLLVFLEDKVQQNSGDLASAYDLAKVYYIVGRIDDSTEILNRLIKVAPQLVASDPAFMQAVGIQLNI